MSSVLSKDGTSIVFDKIGFGPAVILVAGAFSYRMYQGSMELTQLLSRNFTVYNYDRRGRGVEAVANAVDLAGELLVGLNPAGGDAVGEREHVEKDAALERRFQPVVVDQPKLTLIVHAASDSGTPKAASVRLGFSEPDEQALPADTARPAASKRISCAAALTPGMVMA